MLSINESCFLRLSDFDKSEAVSRVKTVMETAIEVQDYSYSISGKQILSQVSMVVRKGENVSIIGPNGAGKTTLLRCIDRVVTGGKGRISINGRSIDDYRQKEIARIIGYVPQTSRNIFPFTVREFVLMARYSFFSPFSSVSKADETAVEQALHMTGVEKWARRNMSTLSGGERQKVLIAGALAQGAEILLLDEPATFLDPYYQDEVYRLLCRLNESSGVTIVSVTHDINNACFFSRRIIALKNGRIVFQGPSEEVMDNEILHRIYNRDFLFVPHPHRELSVIVPGV